MLVALPVLEPDAAAGRRRPEHHRRADIVVGVFPQSHRLSPDPAKGVGNLTALRSPVTQKAKPEFRRVR